MGSLGADASSDDFCDSLLGVHSYTGKSSSVAAQGCVSDLPDDWSANALIRTSDTSRQALPSYTRHGASLAIKSGRSAPSYAINAAEPDPGRLPIIQAEKGA